MTLAAARADAFYAEVAASGVVWAIRDGAGFPTFPTRSGRSAMIFFSSKKRAQTAIKTAASLNGFEPVEIQWTNFCEAWAPGLVRDNLLAGVNWYGNRALGFDLEPMELLTNVEARKKPK